ncbi:MAG: MFS transporter [Tumebacillaceae bacterium]
MDQTVQPSSIWKNHVYTRLFTAFSLSVFGDWFDMVAMLVLFAYQWHADALVVSMVSLTMAVPGILFGQFAGVLADRYNKLFMMISTDFIRAVLTGVLLFMPSPYWALLVLTLRSMAGLFNSPAQQSLTRYVVADEHLLKATSLNGLVNQISKVLGPLIGGALLTWLSPSVCIGINAVSFFVSALVLLTIGKISEATSAEQTKQQAQKSKFRDSFKAGWMVLLQNRMLLYSVIFSLGAGMSIQLVDFQFAVAFREYQPDADGLIGWGMAAIGLGSVCVMLIMNRKKDIKAYGLLIGTGLVLLSLMFICIGYLTPSLPLVVPFAVMFVSGIGNGITALVSSYMYQKEVPKELLGRFFGIQNTLFSFVLLIAPLTGGVLIDAFGARATFKYIGFFLVFWGLVAFVLRNVIWSRKNIQSQTVNSDVAI